MKVNATKLRWSDYELLWLLTLRERHKLTFKAIGHYLGRSRRACAGMYRRILIELKESEAA